MDSPAKIIQYYLAAAGAGVLPTPSSTADWRIYRYQQPDEGDNTITIFDTSPNPDGRDFRSGDYIDQSGVMVRVRAKTPESGTDRIALVIDKLKSIKSTNVTVGAKVYKVSGFTKTSGPAPIGQDEKNRHMFTLNGTVSIRELE